MRKPLPLVTAAFALVAAIGLAAASFSETDLAQAHQLRKSRHFPEARSRFATIAKNKETRLPIRQEAGYWMGYCSVMDQSFLRAIHDFRWFLEAFPGEDNPFLPDTLYVLARTYEVAGQPSPAAYYYKQCLRTKSAAKTPFPAKARAGLFRVNGMLDVESRKPQVASASSEGTPPRENEMIDPFSKKPLTPDQYQRLKLFIQRVAARMPLEKALQTLQPADRKLEVVSRLIALHRQQAVSRPTPGSKEKISTEKKTKGDLSGKMK